MISQTTLLVGGSNGTATLAAILGDKSNPANEGHVLRVATRSGKKYLVDKPSDVGGDFNGVTSSVSVPRTWRCEEKRHLSDLISADIFPTKRIVHVGRPDSVFVYGEEKSVNGTELTPLEQAISGISAPDNGGPVDLIVLCCPVSAHLSLLRRISRALYKLNSLNLLGPSNAPILIGTLYGAGGFDWMTRIAFHTARPESFIGWNRPLALFCLKAFPYLCKSLKAGEVTLHGRFPQIQVAVCPSDAKTRNVAKRVLDRLLQNKATGKELEFLGLTGQESVGGDGTWAEEERALLSSDGWNGISQQATRANGAASAVMIAARTKQQLQSAKDNSTSVAALPPPVLPNRPNGTIHYDQQRTAPTSPALDVLMTHSLSDHADPSSSLAFLTCTLNSTNQILHPCILVALFRDVNNESRSDIDGTIPWNPVNTPFPRFYADGAAKPEAGELITKIAGAEMYFVIDAVERLLSPRGYEPISSLHGGEPLGRKVMNYLGNSPRELGERSGITMECLRREWESTFKSKDVSEGTVMNHKLIRGDNVKEEETVSNRQGLIHREQLLSKLMSYGLSHNGRLNAVLSPCIIVDDKPSDDGTILIKPDVRTRFFTDDTQHGLCIYLGLAELLGLDLEIDMKWTLYVVRRLQRWMEKEFVLPMSGDDGGNSRKRIVSDARDMMETSAPQAFGVKSIGELRQFLKLDVFGDLTYERARQQLMKSGLVSKL
eukprot:CCRYP_019739-RA/>CCRYP_019739-RA protein AED:0.01 eAED:-0.01 QI:0/0/0/1/1/1/2/0/716